MRFLAVCLIIHLAHSKKAARRKTPLVQNVNLEKWKWLSNGSCPYVWMVHFYSKSEDLSARSKRMVQEFEDAAQILKGIVQAGAYVVEKDFPQFIRIPSVLIYMSRSKQPIIFEMIPTKAQVKRVAFNLVEFIKSKIDEEAAKQRVIKSEDCAEVEAYEIVPRMDYGQFVKAVKGYLENTSYLVYVTIADHQEVHKGNVMCLEKILKHGKKSEDHHLFDDMDFGWMNLNNYYTLLGPYLHYFVVPGVALCVCMTESADSRIYTYTGPMNTVDIYGWVRERMLEHFDIPPGTLQLSIARDPGDVGRLLKVENQTLLFQNF